MNRLRVSSPSSDRRISPFNSKARPIDHMPTEKVASEVAILAIICPFPNSVFELNKSSATTASIKPFQRAANVSNIDFKQLISNGAATFLSELTRLTIASITCSIVSAMLLSALLIPSKKPSSSSSLSLLLSSSAYTCITPTPL